MGAYQECCAIRVLVLMTNMPGTGFATAGIADYWQCMTAPRSCCIRQLKAVAYDRCGHVAGPCRRCELVQRLAARALGAGLLLLPRQRRTHLHALGLLTASNRRRERGRSTAQARTEIPARRRQLGLPPRLPVLEDAERYLPPRGQDAQHRRPPITIDNDFPGHWVVPPPRRGPIIDPSCQPQPASPATL